MTLEQVSDVVQIISGLAATVTLVYLTFQIRQNARHQRGAISHSRSAHVQQLMRSLAGSDELMKTVLRGWAGDQTLNDVQANQFFWVVSAAITMFQDTYHQRREGMVSPLMYDSALRTMTFQLTQPGARAVWLIARETYEPAFVAFIDQVMARTPVAAGSADMAGRWRALAAEQAGAPSG